MLVEFMHSESHRHGLYHERNALLASSPPEDSTDTDRQSLPSNPEAPPEYRTQVYDWFKPGRYFKIWARDGDGMDIEIHEKEFVLLDTKNIEGPGLLVRCHEKDECKGHKGSFNRTHVLLKNHLSPEARSPPGPQAAEPRSPPGSQSRSKVVFMDEEEDEVTDNTFIELEHAYNIPFVKYKCIDYGVLTPKSLKQLRRYYVAWLRYHWDLDET